MLCYGIFFPDIVRGGSISHIEMHIEGKMKDKREKGKRERVLPQLSSSVSSPQSLTPSHRQNIGLQNPFLHWIILASHSEIHIQTLISELEFISREQVCDCVCEFKTMFTAHLPHFFSSVLSPQSFQPSQRTDGFTQRLLSQWNCSGQAERFRNYIYFLMFTLTLISFNK